MSRSLTSAGYLALDWTSSPCMRISMSEVLPFLLACAMTLKRPLAPCYRCARNNQLAQHTRNVTEHKILRALHRG